MDHFRGDGFFGFNRPPRPRCLPGAEGAMAGGGCCQVGGRQGLDISCDTEDGERLCTPLPPPAGRGCGSRRPAARLPPPRQRLAQVPLPPSPPEGSEGRRGKEATSGRGLAGRCRPRSPRAALSDRPGNRGPIPPAAGHGTARRPEGPGLEGPQRSSPAEPGDPASRWRGGRALRGGGEGAASPGGAAPATAAPPRGRPGR